jgi:hypothetical protein
VVDPRIDFSRVEPEAMVFKRMFINLGKLLACAVIYEVGVVIGGMLAELLSLQAPARPAGADMSQVALLMFTVTPLFAMALILLVQRIGGGFVSRAAILAFLMWIAYTVNTQLEASIVSTYASGVAFAVVSGAVGALFCGAAVAWLFAPEKEGGHLAAMIHSFFARRSPGSWAWRLPIGAVVFMPIYFVFGLMVLPFTGEYYRQSMFGLAMPTVQQLLPILLVRSVLFFLACLPLFIVWRDTSQSMLWRLGLSLFMLVGFNIMLIATWLPLYVRFPHTLEILADEFVYAGVLTLLLLPRGIEAVVGE